jgi:hypothetical protein
MHAVVVLGRLAVDTQIGVDRADHRALPTGVAKARDGTFDGAPRSRARWAPAVERARAALDPTASPAADEQRRAAEIATRLGVKRPQVVHDWLHGYPDFPEPVATMVWYLPDVEKWARATGRLK